MTKPDDKTTRQTWCPHPAVYDRGECCGVAPCRLGEQSQTTEALPPADWPAPEWDGRPTIVGRNWWHWVQNLHTGNLWCAEWLDRDGAWGHPFSKGRPADVAKNWRYLGVALPPAEWVRMQKVIT